jgi:hypothetical protein
VSILKIINTCPEFGRLYFIPLVQVEEDDVEKANPPSFDRVEDLAQLRYTWEHFAQFRYSGKYLARLKIYIYLRLHLAAWEIFRKDMAKLTKREALFGIAI